MTDRTDGNPRHIGLILDGNRRWAMENGLAKLEGHRKGFENLKTLTLAAHARGIKYISAYVFSTENWKRSRQEVNYLMKLLIWVIQHEVDELHKKGIRMRFVGSPEGLSDKVISAIRKAEEKTEGNTDGTLALCLNYGGHQEIVDAAKSLLQANLKPEEVTVETMQKYLYAPDIPPIDLIIRTSGEKRLSNFMLWRAAYSELSFVDKYWPAFTEEDLDKCLAEYNDRIRRFGV
jgi:undecaprenyl diphosphate synthase